MSEERKVKLIEYGVSFCVGIAMAVCYMVCYDVLSLEGKDLLRILCDAFTIPGLLLIFAGLMLWLSNEGALDGVGYVVSHAFHMLMPGTAHKGESYKAYKERKHEKKPLGFAYLIVTGLVFTAVAVVFLILFQNS